MAGEVRLMRDQRENEGADPSIVGRFEDAGAFARLGGIVREGLAVALLRLPAGKRALGQLGTISRTQGSMVSDAALNLSVNTWTRVA
jgi:hypothetical protein